LSLDLAFLKDWIGRGTEAEDMITPRLLAEFRATLAPHLASAKPGEAPLGLHWCLAPPIVPMAELGVDGHAAKGGFLPPVPLPRRMWAGGEVISHAPLLAGDTVTRRSAVEDLSIKDGRTGPLCFVAVRHEFWTARGLAASERHDIVYRSTEQAPKSPVATAPKPLAAVLHADLSWQVEASPALLFRYSALTFNGHRIHYDYPYVTGVEGYAGLIVHGPVQATLCLNIAGAVAGSMPRQFRYRNLVPLIAGQTFTVAAARRPDGGIDCWTQDATGQICMRGEVLP
jgi:3-methylfumaryl-CoA hydratase